MAWGQAHPVAVGIVLDEPSEHSAGLVAVFQEQISSVLQGEFALVFPAEKTVRADGTASGIAAALDGLLADADVGLVLALGPLASSDAARRSLLVKPVVAPFVPDADFQCLPRQGDASGVANLNYVTQPPRFSRDLQALRELCPLDRVAVLADGRAVGDPVQFLAYATKAAGEAGIQAGVVLVEPGMEILSALPADAQAVYLGPLPCLDASEVDTLIAGLNARKLPTFSMRGREDVALGALAGLAAEQDMKAVAFRVAQNVRRILRGEPAGALPVLLPAEGNLTLNIATARALNLTPAPELAVEAERLNEEPFSAPALTLAVAVDAALGSSPELQGAERDLDEAADEVRDAQAGLKPRAELSTRPAPRDPDRAVLGLPREETLAGAAGVSQVVFSERARADVEVRQRQLEGREYERQQVILDTAHDTAIAYLDVVKAEAFAGLQRRQLRLLRGYLEVARLRQARGVAGPEEVFRWESAQASARKDTIDAQEQVRIAKVTLNGLLRHPQAAAIEVAESGLGDPALAGEYRRVLPYFDVPESFDALSNFLVEEGTEAAPELLKIDAALAAQERVALAARREFYAPTVTVRGEVSQVLESERGRRGRDDSLKLPISLVPEREEADWGVGIRATLPLYAGGARRAAKGKVNADLERLRLERREAKEILEQRIRSAALKLRASHAGVPQAQQATGSAGKSLEAVALAYERGEGGVAALLDAHTAAYVAEQAETEAAYDFLMDLLRLQRASGRFEFLMSERERESWFGRLEAFVGEDKESTP
ncbi:MAG: TolC family protein [FCB group bacterium]|nr:TolC family protein [FCB group bacterium]